MDPNEMSSTKSTGQVPPAGQTTTPEQTACPEQTPTLGVYSAESLCQDRQTTPQDSPSSDVRENAGSPHSPDGPTEDEVGSTG
jgi:hypothetical protein